MLLINWTNKLFKMRVLLDIALVIISTVIVIKTYRDLISYRNLSLSAYVIFLCYIFNCFPILLDLLMGTPNYIMYYDFELAANNDTVSMIYDVYILAAIICFYIYYKKNVVPASESYLKYSKKLWVIQDLLIISPILVVLLFGGGVGEFVYASLADREVDSNISAIVNQLMFISLYFFCVREFGQKKKALTGLWLVFFLIILALISGKRFIIAVVLLSYFFCFICSRWVGKYNTHMTAMLLVVGSFFMAFIVYYITNVKVMGDFSGYIYSQLRIDFGREDVTKFVIMRELEGQPILDYRGESIISTLLMFVPRTVWAAKPYPHYRYLTSSLVGGTPEDLHFGMTPSVFEMMIANFGIIIGIVIAIALIIAITKFGDLLKSTNQKLVVLIVLIQLFTQSLDVIFVLFYYFMFLIITHRYWIKSNLSKIKNLKRIEY